VAALVATVLGVPLLFGLQPNPRRPFDEAPLRAMKKMRPQCVLVGDSMLQTRIDQKALTGLSGERCFVLAQPGSSSATWFLMLKNLVAVQAPPPQTVIILYRNRQLTLPHHRAHGEHRQSMESYMQDSEPLLEKTAGPERPAAGVLDRVVQAVYPIERSRRPAQEKVQSWALDLVASSREYEGIHNSAKQLFSAKNLRVDNTMDEQREGGAISLDSDDHEFGRHVGESFLPQLLKIARERRIHLVFFKVKRRPRPDGSPGEESPTGGAYDQALRVYLETAGARLFDETHEPDVTLDFYGSGDHVAPGEVGRYTEMFWRKVGPLVKAQRIADGQPTATPGLAR
jgi:hypothetical protein